MSLEVCDMKEMFFWSHETSNSDGISGLGYLVALECKV